jgi:hypothetical protein
VAIAELYSLNAVTVGTSELSIVSGTTSLSADTTDGVYQLYIDASNVAKSDVFKVKVYEKCLSGGTKRVYAQWSIMGVQGVRFSFASPARMLVHDANGEVKSFTEYGLRVARGLLEGLYLENLRRERTGH